MKLDCRTKSLVDKSGNVVEVLSTGLDPGAPLDLSVYKFAVIEDVGDNLTALRYLVSSKEEHDLEGNEFFQELEAFGNVG